MRSHDFIRQSTSCRSSKIISPEDSDDEEVEDSSEEERIEKRMKVEYRGDKII